MIKEKTKDIKKVIILGSGAIRIGQAGEFDYSGSQAIKALKEEGIKTVLVNPNIATIQTSDYLADKVYFLPINSYFVEKIIKKEKPDGILLSFGGQTALDVGVELYKKKILKENNVKILGTPVESILTTEDRDLFVKKIKECGLKVPKSKAVESVDEALKTAGKIGYPVMCRVAYALGGLGSGIVNNKEELTNLVKKAFSFTKQILIEECCRGWKEIECEVVRDCDDNCIVVCGMENLDPMGIHTGESIVVAPVQTLTSKEYFKLRSISIKVIRNLGIVGECNIQFALDPKSEEYRIIEVNARLSRSSALASKATGYPLAFIATKLALGYNLTKIRNVITKETSACFEPSLDYVVVKYPRWDLQKFKGVTPILSSEMKSVGEVMAIGRNFEEVLQKSIRMLDIGMNGVLCNDINFTNVETELKKPTDKRMFAVAEALKQGFTVEKIHELTGIDPWFLYKIKNLVKTEKNLKNHTIKNIPISLLKEAKKEGFSDKQIALLVNSSEKEIRKKRKKHGIIPYVKQIDTLAAEYPAKTNYLYLTYNGIKDDIEFKEKNEVIVLGGGAYRIGSSVEFDWCCVNTVSTLKKLKYQTILINCNPETVSTDYDICDKLYFEELTHERVLDICEKENPLGVIVSMGGQIPNNLALPLYNSGIKILGTSPKDIDRAENRNIFSNLLDELGIDQPEWRELKDIKSAEKFADKVGYPVLVRPSYVLSGAAMSIALSTKELRTYLKKASDVNKDHPVVISKFIEGGKEIEVDAVAKKGKVVAYAVSEHVENAGVHSGDATIVLPPQRTYIETMRKVKIISKKIAKALNITGPFNIQFIAKENHVKVIECNLRASRSFPFASKVFKINFVDIATKIFIDKWEKTINRSSFDLDYVGVKAPQFSFKRLKGSDPVLGVEMASTGEVACIGEDFSEAFLNSIISTGFKLPEKNILLSTGTLENKADFLKSAKKLEEMGYKFYATQGTADFLEKNNIDSKKVFWPSEKKEPNALTLIENGEIDLVVNIPKNTEKEELDNDYLIRRQAVDFGVSLITNIQLAKRLVESIERTNLSNMKIKSWDEFI